MPLRYSHLPAWQLEPAEKTLRAAINTWNSRGARTAAEKCARVFVTVSREPGRGDFVFASAGGAFESGGAGDWSAWDRELVEKVSAEHGIAREIIEMIPNRHHNWLDDLLQGFAASPNPPDIVEIRAYKRVVMTIRALATAGHAIIVGQGGNFITEGMRAGIHLRLVAPLAYRIQSMGSARTFRRRRRVRELMTSISGEGVLSQVLAGESSDGGWIHDDAELGGDEGG